VGSWTVRELSSSHGRELPRGEISEKYVYHPFPKGQRGRNPNVQKFENRLPGPTIQIKT
jgi:hypothetical protein